MDDNKLLKQAYEKMKGSPIVSEQCQSLQDKTGATAREIRQAIEIIGFDRDRVEQYLADNKSVKD